MRQCNICDISFWGSFPKRFFFKGAHSLTDLFLLAPSSLSDPHIGCTRHAKTGQPHLDQHSSLKGRLTHLDPLDPPSKICSKLLAFFMLNLLLSRFTLNARILCRRALTRGRLKQPNIS